MKKINCILIVLIIIIFFFFYIQYTQSGNYFLCSEYNLLQLSYKTYNLKYEYDKKRNIINSSIKLLELDDVYFYNYLEYLNNNYNNSLRLINMEVEQIKNLNKRYNHKIKNINIINQLTIIKSDYLKELEKIQNIGYDNIIKLETHNTNLLNNLYNVYLSEINNKYYILSDLQKKYKLDIDIINTDYVNILDLLKSKLKSNLKSKNKNKSKCKLHISWGDTDKQIIKCCKI